MVHSRLRCGTYLGLAALALLGFRGLVGYAEGTRPPTEGDEGQPKTVYQVRRILDTPITFEFERGPLREALAYLQDRYQLPILVDQKAFQQDRKAADVQDIDVAVPKMVGIKLDTVFQILLEQVDGAIQIQDGVAWVVPKERMQPEHLLRRPITVRVRQQPLTEVLSELAQTAEFSVVVDVRASDKAKAPVSAAFHKVPLEEAVFVLADMASLKPVKLGHVLYVTTRDNAREIQAERDPPRVKMSRAD